MKEYDLIIIGAGTGGCAAAIRAGSLGLKTLLLDSLSEEKVGDKTCGDCMRGSEIRWVREILGVDLEPAIAAKNMGVSILSEDGKIRKRISPKKVDKVTVFRHKMGQLLLKKAKAFAMVELRCGVRVQGPLLAGGKVRGIRLAGEELGAHVVIDASGALGAFRKKVDLPDSFLEREVGKMRMAFAFREILTVKKDSECPDDVLAIFEKTKTGGGYIWYFPLGGGSYNAGLGGDSFRKLKWKNLLHEDYELRGLAVRAPAEKSSGAYLPARAFSSCPVAPGYIGVGDAAFGVSPVDGAGIQASMIGGVLAAETVSRAAEKGSYGTEDLWSYTGRYLRYCYPHTNHLHGASTSALEPLKLVLQKLTAGEFSLLLGCIHDNFLEDVYTISMKNLSRILGSLLRLSLRPSLSLRLARGLWKVSRLRRHYLHYPENPAGFLSWKKKLDTLEMRGRA